MGIKILYLHSMGISCFSLISLISLRNVLAINSPPFLKYSEVSMSLPRALLYFNFFIAFFTSIYVYEEFRFRLFVLLLYSSVLSLQRLTHYQISYPDSYDLFIVCFQFSIICFQYVADSWSISRFLFSTSL